VEKERNGKKERKTSLRCTEQVTYSLGRTVEKGAFNGFGSAITGFGERLLLPKYRSAKKVEFGNKAE